MNGYKPCPLCGSTIPAAEGRIENERVGPWSDIDPGRMYVYGILTELSCVRQDGAGEVQGVVAYRAERDAPWIGGYLGGTGSMLFRGFHAFGDAKVFVDQRLALRA